jgi:hypothetical protein
MSNSVKTTAKPSFIRKEKAIPTSTLGETLKVKLTASKVEYLYLWIGGPGVGDIPSQLAIHRPIGITDLASDEWVASDPATAQLLLTRLVDPRDEEIKKKRSAFLRDGAVKKGLIFQNGDVLSYSTGKDRNEFLKPFRSEVKERAKAAKELAKLSSGGYGKIPKSAVPKKQSDVDVLKGLLSDAKEKEAEEELRLMEYFSNESNQKVVEKQFPTTFRTMGGAYADTPQVPLKWAKGLTPMEVKAYAINLMGALTDRLPDNPVMERVFGRGLPKEEDQSDTAIEDLVDLLVAAPLSSKDIEEEKGTGAEKSDD